MQERNDPISPFVVHSDEDHVLGQRERPSRGDREHGPPNLVWPEVVKHFAIEGRERDGIVAQERFRAGVVKTLFTSSMSRERDAALCGVRARHAQLQTCPPWPTRVRL